MNFLQSKFVLVGREHMSVMVRILFPTNGLEMREMRKQSSVNWLKLKIHSSLVMAGMQWKKPVVVPYANKLYCYDLKQLANWILGALAGGPSAQRPSQLKTADFGARFFIPAGYIDIWRCSSWALRQGHKLPKKRRRKETGKSSVPGGIGDQRKTLHSCNIQDGRFFLMSLFWRDTMSPWQFKFMKQKAVRKSDLVGGDFPIL